MNTTKKIVFLVFAVVMAGMFVIASCGSEPATGPDGGADTAAGPENTPAPETGKAPKFGEDCTADVVVTTTMGGSVVSVIESKVYNSVDATRSEVDMPMGMGADAPTISMIIIDRRDLGVSWQLFPGSMRYVETEIVTDPADGVPTMNMHDILYSGDYKLEKMGTEEVNGYKCDKYIIDPGTETLPNITIWSAKKLDGVVIKTLVESSDGSTMTNELFNVEVGKPDASHFELPEDYTKASEEEVGMLMMQEMMK